MPASIRIIIGIIQLTHQKPRPNPSRNTTSYTTIKQGYIDILALHTFLKTLKVHQ